MIHLATIGTSAITEHFLDACQLSGRYRFVACYSRNHHTAAAFAQKHSFEKTYTDLEAMAADPQIHGVYIASPNVFHYQQCKLFLSHGKHVLCEKPIVTCHKEYAELLSLADSKNLIYMEAIMSRHSAGRSVLLDALSEIGSVTQARIAYCQRSSRYDQFLAGQQVNIFDMSLAAGALMDLGVYCVYGALDLLGKPLQVDAQASFLANGADGSGSAIFTYPNYLATLSYSKTGTSALGSEIIGDRGTVLIGSISQYSDICLLKDGVRKQLYDTPSRREVMCQEAIRFADFIEDPTDNRSQYKEVCTLAENVHRTMDCIKSSADIVYPNQKQSPTSDLPQI